LKEQGVNGSTQGKSNGRLGKEVAGGHNRQARQSSEKRKRTKPEEASGVGVAHWYKQNLPRSWAEILH